MRSFYPQDYQDTHALSRVQDYQETHALSRIQDYREEPMLSLVYEITGMTHALSCTQDYRDHPCLSCKVTTSQGAHLAYGPTLLNPYGTPFLRELGLTRPSREQRQVISGPLGRSRLICGYRVASQAPNNV